MATQTKTLTAIPETLDYGMQIAYEILKQAWLEEGMTEEQWEQNRIKEEILNRMAGQTQSWEKADAFLEKATWEEIVLKHQELFPLRYETK